MNFSRKKIRPALVERCYKCHSTDAEKTKGGLLLDSRESLLKGGDTGPAVVAGEPEKSRLIQAIRYLDDDLQMPPKEKLSPAQITDFETWVKMGAPYPEKTKAPGDASRITRHASRTAASGHWAFRPPKKPSIPSVANKAWPKHPIDHFILAELEDKKLTPASPADKRSLLRRAIFDLIGLPPTPEEIGSFLNDSSPNAFAKVVDRLLDSRHFGERWGRHWLDVVRYADSNGLEVNLPYPNAWRYRDYVVDSFNNNKPFDQFIREQLAGDLLPHKTDEERFEHLIATGFLVLGPKALGEPNRTKLTMDFADEQIDVTTRAFLGLTASCARCHDHKYDPIPTKDYYALAGIFKSTARLSTAGPGPQNPFGTRWIERPLAGADKAKEVEDYFAKLNKLTAELRDLQEYPGGLRSGQLPGIVVDNSAAQLQGRWKKSDYVGTFVDKDYHHDAKSDKGKMSARYVPNLPHAGQDEVLVGYVPRFDRATNVPVTIQSVDKTNQVALNQTLPPMYKNSFVSVGTYEFQTGTNGSVIISNENTKGFVTVDSVIFVPIDEWKLEMSMNEPVSMKASGSAMMAASSRSMTENARDELGYALSSLRTSAPPPMPSAMAVQEGTIENCRINIRGDPDKLGEEVPRGFLTVLSGSKASSLFNGKESGRLELANWVASVGNPLTTRVAVNRIWLHLFGKGLVDTPDNFGLLSERPTHPELLDYLAVQFVQDGWSCKKTIRTIMLTSAYQMSCEHDAKAYAKDPDNRYLWRMNRRRLEAEAIRDAVLAVSGELDSARGVSLISTNDMRMNNPIAGMQLPPVTSNRRSIYLPVVRNDVPDLFQVFDFADPHTIAGKRHVTTAATQALFMMNSEFVQEQARQWAQALLAQPTNDDQRIANAYMRAFGRPITSEEKQRALDSIAKLEKTAAQNEAAKNRLTAWQCFCQALLASTEFRFLN